MPRIRIAVNTRLLIRNRLDGIGWFTYETLSRITKAHPEVSFYFFFDRKPDPGFLFSDNVKPIVISPQARHPLLFVVWFEISVARMLRKIKPDLFLSPDGYLSLSTRTESLAVMHDLNFEHFPADLPWLVRWYYRFFFPRFAHKAVRIATVSEYSKRDIIAQYGVPDSLVDVVYNGSSTKFVPLSASEISQVRTTYSDGKPYFLFVGSLHPRKNLARLFAAFDLFRDESPDDIELLVVGEKLWWTRTIRESYENMKHRDNVHFCGRLGMDELCRVTASALAVTYVSCFEGFGIPIVEAFNAGVPVITSNVTSMPEVAAEAAEYVDPYDAGSIKNALKRVSSSPELRAHLVELGFKRSRDFSWDKTAQLLWESIQKAMNQHKNI